MVALFLCEAVVSSGLLCGDTADCAYSVQCHSFLVLKFFLSCVLCYVLVNGIQCVSECVYLVFTTLWGPNVPTSIIIFIGDFLVLMRETANKLYTMYF